MRNCMHKIIVRFSNVNNKQVCRYYFVMSGKSKVDSNSSKGTVALKEVLWPPMGYIYSEESMHPVFCKPKLCPLKSVTLEKLEKMQREALEKLKERERTTAAPPTLQEEILQTSDSQSGNVKTEIWKADENISS